MATSAASAGVASIPVSGSSVGLVDLCPGPISVAVVTSSVMASPVNPVELTVEVCGCG